MFQDALTTPRLAASLSRMRVSSLLLITTSALFIPNVARSEDLIVDGRGIFSGNLTASEVNVTNSTVSGTSTVAGALKVGGSTQLTNLAVSGGTAVSGTLTANSDLNVFGSTTLANANISGVATVSGALNVTGTTTLKGAQVTEALNVIAPLNVTGNSTLSGALSVTGRTTTDSIYVGTSTNTDTLIVRRGANVGQLSVSGNSQLSNTTIQGSLTATGPTTLASANIANAVVERSLTVGGPLDVTAPASFSGPVFVAGTTTTGNAVVTGLTDTGTLNVRDAASLGKLAVSGSSSLGHTSVAGNLDVTGRTSTGSLSAAEIDTQNLNVSGTLTVENLIDLRGKYSFSELNVDGKSTLGDTDITGEFAATNGANALHMGKDGFTVTSGANGSAVVASEKEATLLHQGSGIRTASGTTEVSGSTRTSVSGGGTTLAVSNAGARLSGPAGAPARLSGIADGVEHNDAVNVGQMNAGLERAGYGIAMSMAMANLPAPRDGSTYSVGMAVGSFGGMEALAIGGSALLSDTAALRASVSKAGGTVGGGVGIGWSF